MYDKSENSGIAFFRGIVIACIISIPIWLLIIWGLSKLFD